MVVANVLSALMKVAAVRNASIRTAPIVNWKSARAAVAAAKEMCYLCFRDVVF
jgi:hypothetical protein